MNARTETKHTPGPWEARNFSNEHYRQPVSIVAGKTAIATMQIPGQELNRLRTPDAAEQEANAKIIAAAPVLLAALKRSVAKLERCAADPLNPCWDNRPTDAAGQHWGGGSACAFCEGRAVLAAVE